MPSDAYDAYNAWGNNIWVQPFSQYVFKPQSASMGSAIVSKGLKFDSPTQANAHTVFVSAHGSNLCKLPSAMMWLAIFEKPGIWLFGLCRCPDCICMILGVKFMQIFKCNNMISQLYTWPGIWLSVLFKCLDCVDKYMWIKFVQAVKRSNVVGYLCKKPGSWPSGLWKCPDCVRKCLWINLCKLSSKMMWSATFAKGLGFDSFAFANAQTVLPSACGSNLCKLSSATTYVVSHLWKV